MGRVFRSVVGVQPGMPTVGHIVRASEAALDESEGDGGESGDVREADHVEFCCLLRRDSQDLQGMRGSKDSEGQNERRQKREDAYAQRKTERGAG